MHLIIITLLDHLALVYYLTENSFMPVVRPGTDNTGFSIVWVPALGARTVAVDIKLLASRSKKSPVVSHQYRRIGGDIDQRLIETALV